VAVRRRPAGMDAPKSQTVERRSLYW